MLFAFEAGDFLDEVKSRSADDIVRHWGSIENFNMFIQKIKDEESEVAKLAIQQFGSVEKYTEAMKYNLEHFSEIMEKQLSQIPEEMKASDLFVKLASHKGEAIPSDRIQNMVREIISCAYENAPSELLGNEDNYCKIITDAYSNDHIKRIFDTKQGEGASDYIVKAFRYYSENNTSKNK